MLRIELELDTFVHMEHLVCCTYVWVCGSRWPDVSSTPSCCQYSIVCMYIILLRVRWCRLILPYPSVTMRPWENVMHFALHKYTMAYCCHHQRGERASRRNAGAIHFSCFLVRGYGRERRCHLRRHSNCSQHDCEGKVNLLDLEHFGHID